MIKRPQVTASKLVAKSTAFKKAEDMVNEMPQLRTQANGKHCDAFTPVHQYVPSYLEKSDNSVIILSQDLGKSERKGCQVTQFDQPKYIKSPHSIKQDPVIDHSEQAQEQPDEIEVKRSKNVTDFVD
jgi:hypothetical protein